MNKIQTDKEKSENRRINGKCNIYSYDFTNLYSYPFHIKYIGRFLNL